MMIPVRSQWSRMSAKMAAVWLPSLRACKNLFLLQLNQLLRPLKRTLLNVYIIKGRLSVHVPQLRHHHLHRHARFRALGPEGMPQVVEAKSLHVTRLH